MEEREREIREIGDIWLEVRAQIYRGDQLASPMAVLGIFRIIIKTWRGGYEIMGGRFYLVLILWMVMAPSMAGCTQALRLITERGESASSPVNPAVADQTAAATADQAAGDAPTGTTVSTPATPSPQPEVDPAPPTDYFRDAINRATSAVAIGQTAQSKSDWTLAASRWQQAIQLMQQVPTGDPHYTDAQTKVREYQHHLASAQQQVNGPPSATATTAKAAPPPNGLVAQIPISGRAGGTPLVPVTLIGNKDQKTFQMLFDTGATGTLITAEMASAIGVVIVGQTQAKVADGTVVNLPIGYIDTLEVGGLKKQDVLVAIGGDMGLLGQDFYGDYGIGMGSHAINLYK